MSSFNPDGVDDVRFEFISDRCNGRHEDPPTKRPRDLLTLGLGHTGAVWLGAQIANQIAPRLNISPATIAASGIS